MELGDTIKKYNDVATKAGGEPIKIKSIMNVISNKLSSKSGQVDLSNKKFESYQIDEDSEIEVVDDEIWRKELPVDKVAAFRARALNPHVNAVTRGGAENDDIAVLIGRKGIIANALREVVSIGGKLDEEHVFLRFESLDEKK